LSVGQSALQSNRTLNIQERSAGQFAKPPGPTPVLLDALRQGTPAALATVYEQYAPDVLRLAQRILGSRADAEDLLHDLIVGLPELLNRYEERGDFRAWLRAVTVRRALMTLRRDRRREQMISANSSASDPLARRDGRWDALDLAAAIDWLPDTLRVVFVLRQLEGYSHAEVAELLSISPGASRVRHLRALRQLRQRLESGK
jgi:RNA polymerase sigma-70 factor (ECF subfamily)